MADSSESEGLTNEEHASSSPRHSTPRSRKSGMTSDSNMNAKTAYGLQDESIDGMSGRDGGGEDSGPSPSKMRSPRPRSSGVGSADTQSVDTRLSDPDRIKKDREREERVRIARERLEEERKKKLVELQEQQRQAQENREKQLEMRRQKIEDLRRRDIERRAAVEERRKAKEDADRNRRETLLIKAEERVARYEQWRRTGQKGGRSHCLGFGSATPRAVCQPMERPRRSSSHSALMRRSPNGSDSDYSFRPQRRALSACSTIRRHCCVDINRMGRSILTHAIPRPNLQSHPRMVWHAAHPVLAGASAFASSLGGVSKGWPRGSQLLVLLFTSLASLKVTQVWFKGRSMVWTRHHFFLPQTSVDVASLGMSGCDLVLYRGMLRRCSLENMWICLSAIFSFCPTS